MKRFVNDEEVDLVAADGVEVTPLSDRLTIRSAAGLNTAVAIRSGDSIQVSFRGNVYVVEKARTRAKGQGGASSGEIRAPMPGQIVEVFVQEGQKVTKGEKLLVLEAMKTHQSFTAPFDGAVAKVGAAKGAQVADGDLLCLVQSIDAQPS